MGHVYSIHLENHFYMKMREVNSSHTIMGSVKINGLPNVLLLQCTVIPFALVGNGRVNPSIRQLLHWYLLLYLKHFRCLLCYFLYFNNPLDFVNATMPIRSGQNYLDWSQLQGLLFFLPFMLDLVIHGGSEIEQLINFFYNTYAFLVSVGLC